MMTREPVSLLVPGTASCFELWLASGEPLRVHRISVWEDPPAPARVRVIARSPEPGADLDAIVGHPAAVRLASGHRFASGGPHTWTGICRDVRRAEAAELAAGETGMSVYELAILPLRFQPTPVTPDPPVPELPPKISPEICGEE